MILIFVAFVALSSRLATFGMTEESKRLYDFSKVNGAGCPYTASWLAHINLFIKSHWWMESTKMEAASFNIFDKSKLKFQVADPDAYFVHHMSMYEHLIHKKIGFAEAQAKTLIMSRHAMMGECSNLTISRTTEYLALVPFYGGLPPNVTKDLSVKSIGQGNSLVDASTKVLQSMATVCSCLRYFGHAVVGTVRPQDRILIAETLEKLDPKIKARVQLVSLRMNKPAHLPFHLLAWGQNYVKSHNCPPPDASDDQREEFETKGYISSTLLAGKSNDYKDLYTVCTQNLHKNWHGVMFNVTDHRQSDLHKFAHSSSVSLRKTKDTGEAVQPLRFVYYTECDQIVRFDSETTFDALSAASNESCFFVGRRRDKVYSSAPEDYMGSLDNYRNCGERGYSMIWPGDKYVRHG